MLTTTIMETYLNTKLEQLDSKVVDFCQDPANRSYLLTIRNNPEKLKMKIEEIIGRELPEGLQINLVQDTPNQITLALPPAPSVYPEDESLW